MLDGSGKSFWGEQENEVKEILLMGLFIFYSALSRIHFRIYINIHNTNTCLIGAGKKPDAVR